MGRQDNRLTAKTRRKRAQRKKKATLKRRIAEKISSKPMNRKGAKGAASKTASSSVRRTVGSEG